MKKEKIIYYSNKYEFGGSTYVDIIENVDGVDVFNYRLGINDLRKLKSNPIFDGEKLKYKVRFVNSKEVEA